MTDKPPLPADFCPYVGLDPYTESHRDFFFGRERDQKLIISNLYAMPLTVLYGASGVGKSSLLLAGVVPQLKQDAHVDFVVFREWQGADFANTLKKEVLHSVIGKLGAEKSSVKKVIENRLLEATDKLNKLETSATQVESDALPQEQSIQELSGLVHALRSIETYVRGDLKVDDIALDDLLSHCTRVSNRTIFLILDQFEEYFLYHPPSKSSDSFDAEFARAVNRKDIPAKFLLSMREEELGKLGRFRGRIPNMLGNPIFLKHLDDKAAELAVRKPLIEYNSRVSDAQKMDIDKGLVGAVVEKSRQGDAYQSGKGAVAERTGAQLPIETPILQMLLTRLWEEERKAQSNIMRLSTLEDLGGAENIVRTYLDKVMNEMKGPQLAVAAEMFRFLVTPSGSKIAHTLADLADYTKESPAQVELTLKPLLMSSPMRVMRKVSVSGQADRYEIFHDVLGRSIEDWRRRHEIRLDEQAEAERQQQQKRARRRRLGVGALVVAVILMSVVTGYALIQRRSAVAAQVRAEQATTNLIVQQQETDRQKDLAEKQRQSAADERNQAEIQKAQFELQAKLAKAEEEKKIALARRDEEEKQKLNVLAAQAKTANAELEKVKAETAANEATADAAATDTELKKLEEVIAELAKVSPNTVKINPNPTELAGIDISHHNGVVDWRKVKEAGVSFVFLKATQGARMKDPRFADNSQGAREVGILQGAYHFFVPTLDAEQQANFFLQTIGNKTDLPAVLDVEPMTRINVSPATVMQGMRKWLQIVEQKTGCRPIIYTTTTFARQFISSKEFGNYRLWIGSYDRSSPQVPEAWTDWTIWQYTFKGSVKGISGTVDLNRIRGSDLNQLLCKPKP